MDWDAIGAVSEIIGAAAVVISLLYLAVQLRQGTELARTQYHTNSVTTIAPIQYWKAASSENARIFREGMMDFRSLSPDDRVMLDGILVMLVLTFKDVMEAHDRGFMDQATYEAWEGYVGTNIGMPGASMWWEQGRALFIDKVQLRVDAAIKKTPPYQELMSVVLDNET
jgi:hypothetical protein